MRVTRQQRRGILRDPSRRGVPMPGEGRRDLRDGRPPGRLFTLARSTLSSEMVRQSLRRQGGAHPTPSAPARANRIASCADGWPPNESASRQRRARLFLQAHDGRGKSHLGRLSWRAARLRSAYNPTTAPSPLGPAEGSEERATCARHAPTNSASEWNVRSVVSRFASGPPEAPYARNVDPWAKMASLRRPSSPVGSRTRCGTRSALRSSFRRRLAQRALPRLPSGLMTTVLPDGSPYGNAHVPRRERLALALAGSHQSPDCLRKRWQSKSTRCETGHASRDLLRDRCRLRGASPFGRLFDVEGGGLERKDEPLSLSARISRGSRRRERRRSGTAEGQCRLGWGRAPVAVLRFDPCFRTAAPSRVPDAIRRAASAASNKPPGSDKDSSSSVSRVVFPWASSRLHAHPRELQDRD